MLAPIGAALAAWLVLGAAAELAGRVRARPRRRRAEALRRARNLPRADWGKALAHAGLGVTIFGIAAHHRLGESRTSAPSAPATASPSPATSSGSTAVEPAAARTTPPSAPPSTVLARRPRASARCTRRSGFTTCRRMATTEAGIDRGLTRDLYVALGDPQPDGAWALRTYVKPFANWIWAGALIMAAGGVVSLTDRRYRVGAPARRAPPAALPAE